MCVGIDVSIPLDKVRGSVLLLLPNWDKSRTLINSLCIFVCLHRTNFSVPSDHDNVCSSSPSCLEAHRVTGTYVIATPRKKDWSFVLEILHLNFNENYNEFHNLILLQYKECFHNVLLHMYVMYVIYLTKEL